MANRSNENRNCAVKSHYPFTDNQGSVRLSTRSGKFRGDRLKGLREAKGLSQEQLEALSGVSHTMITKYERGKSRPSGESLNSLAVALDATIEYFYGREFEDDDPAANDPKMAAALYNNISLFSVRREDRPSWDQEGRLYGSLSGQQERKTT